MSADMRCCWISITSTCECEVFVRVSFDISLSGIEYGID